MAELEIQYLINVSFPGIANTQLLDLSNETTLILTFIIYSVMCQIICLFGIVTNIINILCFAKQGFKESVNISLLGLAISDLCCLMTMVCTNLLITMMISAADIPFIVVDVLYLVCGRPHVAMSRVTSWITAVITLERCLCIIAPLKVKNIVTPKRLSIVITSIFIFLLFCESPVYIVNKLGFKFYPERNQSLLGLVSTPDREKVEKMTFTINSFVIPFAAFIVIIVCTAILVVTLQRRTKWQRQFSTASKNDGSNRNQRVARMVVMISALFICCFIPITMIILALAFEPGLAVGGKYINIGLVVFGIGAVLESINSSANIFIYYLMSSKYKETFCSIFHPSIPQVEKC